MQQSVNHPDQYASSDRHQVHGIPFRNHHMRGIICDPPGRHLDQNAISAQEKLSIAGKYCTPELPVDSRNDQRTDARKNSPGLQGDFSTQTRLATLLADTGLEGIYTRNNDLDLRPGGRPAQRWHLHLWLFLWRATPGDQLSKLSAIKTAIACGWCHCQIGTPTAFL